MQGRLFDSGFVIMRDNHFPDETAPIYFCGMVSDGQRELRSWWRDSQKAVVYDTAEEAEEILSSWHTIAREHNNYRVEAQKRGW